MKKILIIKILAFLVILSITIFIINNNFISKTIKIGFISDLSGKNSELGISARNGLELGINEINNTGGLKGKKLVLIIRDHEGSKNLCVSRTKELVDSGVNVIISPILSGMASSVIQGVGDKKVLIIGPTVSTDDLSNIDDNFLRLASSAFVQGAYIADVSKNKLDKKVVIIVDEKNSAYTFGASQGFKDSVGKDIVVDEIIFRDTLDSLSIVKKLKDIKPDGIFFLTNGIDSATIIQQLAKDVELPNLYGGSWVKVSEINKFGGSRVEGMILVDTFFNEQPRISELNFNKLLKSEYSMEGNSVSIYFYDALKIYYLAVLESKSTDLEDVKQAILKMDNFEGVREDFHLNKYGDGVRKMSLFVIKNNVFELYKE